MDVNLTGDLLSAGSALSGLIIVFLGGVLNAYDSYATDQKKSVRSRFRKRAWFCFAGFCLALLGTLVAFLAKLSNSAAGVVIAAALQGLALAVLLKMALDEVRSI